MNISANSLYPKGTVYIWHGLILLCRPSG